MNVKIRRSTLILNYLYNYYLPNICFNSFLSRLETYGYELEKGKNIISGIFNKSDICSLIIISTYLISKLNPKIEPKVYKVNINNLNVIFSFLKNIYFFNLEDVYEIVNNSEIVINDFILTNIKINKYTKFCIPDNVSKLVDRIDEINVVCDINTFKTPTKIINNRDNKIREYLLIMHAKEIMTHPIICLDVKCPNRLKYSYLSHNYLRKNIYQSFIYDYKEYKEYNFVFEIADCYNLAEYVTYKHIFISMHKSSLITLINIVKYSKISYRPFIHNGVLYNVNSMCRLIGKYKEYKNHRCLEVYMDKIRQFSPTIFANKTYDFNIINFCNSEIIIIYMCCIRIELVEVIDVYKDKYTIRIYTSLSYNRIVDILKRIFCNRLT